MKISIVGNDTLAAATRFGCSKFHEIVDKSECPDILWACYDTPISANGDADYKWVIDNISEDILSISTKTLIIISSQIQIGTIRHMETEFPDYTFCYVPENIRVATANDDFIKQSRIVAGRRSDKDDELICSLLTPFTEFILYTTPETAEMVKHALNCWLGMNIAFINEIARIGDAWGIEMPIVSRALMSDSRISPKAPLKAGGPFGGGHLSRDIKTLVGLSYATKTEAPIIRSILKSNE
jgi:UDPglucose 6-dehydrogenase